MSINPLSDFAPNCTQVVPNIDPSVPSCTHHQDICPRDAKAMTLVLSSMGNLCLHTVPVYEARTVAELASRVVEKQGKETKVGDLEKLLGSSCASKNLGSCQFLYYCQH